jgi:aminopeptidase N
VTPHPTVPRRSPSRTAAAALAGLTVAALAAGCTLGPASGQWAPLPAGTAAPGPSPEAPPVPVPAIPGGSSPVADPVYPDYGNPALDVLHYDLKLRWSPTDKRLTGTATLKIRAAANTDDLVLDLHGALTVDKVTVDGASARSTHEDDDLTVALPDPLAVDDQTTLVVTYHGTPREVSMPSNRGDAARGLGLRPEADGSLWTMQEPYGAFTWYPVTDHPSDEALYDISVTVPEGWSGIANGQLMSTTTGSGGRVTFHWHSADPVASYLTTLAVGRYKKITDTGPRGIPLTYWLRTGEDEELEDVARRTPELLSWLEERFGPYPFPSAGAVWVESDSAMETQQMVTMGGDITQGLTDPEQAEAYMTEVLLHEYAHQWFGNAVTPRDWRAVWLSEGFAMFAEGEWLVDQGFVPRERFIEFMREDDRRSRREAGPPGRWKPDHFAENNIYVGPALMLHELRAELGERRFYAMARDWVQTQRNQPVDRETFTAFVNKHTGQNFTELIDLWLDSPTTPPR